MSRPTNIEVANAIDTSSRQVSRCNRRGWLYLYKDQEFDSDGELKPRKLDFSQTFSIATARAHRREEALDA